MPSPREQLSAAMDARRAELRLTWDQVSAEAGIHRETLRNIRSGKGGLQLRTLTKAGIEDALQWTHGSIDAILAGGEPVALSAPEPDQARTVSDELDDLEELLTDPEARQALRVLLRKIRGEPPDEPPASEKAG